MPPTPDRPIRLTPEQALSLWREALQHELGIRIAMDPNDIDRIRQEMYRVRKESGDESLRDLQLIIASGSKELWIIRKTVEVE